MLYNVVLNRNPSSDEVEKWAAKAKINSRLFILKGFIQSSEFTNLCEKYGVTRGFITVTEIRDLYPDVAEFIARIYVNCLNRNADTDGLNNWTKQFVNEEKTTTEIVYGIINSSEFQNKNESNGDYVTAMYKGLLGREPDSAGWENWVSQMDCGKTRFSLFVSFVKSKEFKEICTDFGVDDYLTDLSSIAAFVKAKNNCYVYQSANLYGKNYGLVYKNQILVVTGFCGEWLQVMFQNEKGYIPMSSVNTYNGSEISILPVMNIPQTSTIGGVSLPTGCEITSLAVLLNYLGFSDATKNSLANEYMPTGPIGLTDPNVAFIGSPSSSYSYGIYANGIVKSAQNYFSDKNIADYSVNNITGVGIDELFAEIDKGNPVLVWFTMNCTSTRSYGATWSLPTNTQYTLSGSGTYDFTWKKNEHCSVLVGYNKSAGTVILADVWANGGVSTSGLTEYSMSDFLSAYNWLGQQAITITK